MLESLLEIDKSEARKIIESIFIYFEENRNHIQVLMSEQGDIDFQKDLLKLIYEYCRKISPDGKFGDIIADEYFFVYAVNGSIGIIQHWLKTEPHKSAGEMAEILCSLAFN